MQRRRYAYPTDRLAPVQPNEDMYRLHAASLTYTSIRPTPAPVIFYLKFFGMLLHDDLSVLSCLLIGILTLSACEGVYLTDNSSAASYWLDGPCAA